MFGFVDRVTQRVQQAVSSVRRSATEIFGKGPAKKGFFDVQQSGFGDVIDTLDTIENAMDSGRVVRGYTEGAAEATVDRIRELVDPISRTGRLKNSFDYRQGDDESEVYSDVEYAESIDDGMDELVPPPVDALLEWMKNKPELSGYTGKRARRVAFAIQNSIRQRIYNTTGRSDLMDLPPTGERRYNYIDIAADEARYQMGIASENVAEILGGKRR